MFIVGHGLVYLDNSFEQNLIPQYVGSNLPSPSPLKLFLPSQIRDCLWIRKNIYKSYPQQSPNRAPT